MSGLIPTAPAPPMPMTWMPIHPEELRSAEQQLGGRPAASPRRCRSSSAAPERGRLRRPLPRPHLVPHELTALYPASRRALPQVRALLEALAAGAARPPSQ